MLRWDTKTKTSKGKGRLGTVRAFAGADEEQGRKSLHQHWQIWVEEINQTVRNALFNNDNETRNKAWKTFQEHIDNVVSTSYGPQLCITHKCIGEKDQETLKTDFPENLFKEKEPESFCQARHKELCNDIRGDIMFCQYCEQTISTTNIVNQSLKRWKDSVIWGTRAQDNRPDTIIPLSQARLDMAAYTFSYHMNGGCALELDPFWGNNCICETLLKIGLKNTQPLILHHVSKKAASVDFFTHSCQLLLHTYTRTEVTTT